MRRSDSISGGPVETLGGPALVGFAGFTIIGVCSYFALARGSLAFYLLAHLGALGLLGLVGVVTGLLARAKKRNILLGFVLGCVLPVVLGALSVLCLDFTCGGTVALAAGILAVASYAVVGRRSRSPVT